jgi:mannitol/fructose-specific phosphotransferase system IIA component (Ntr-type)
MDLNDFFGPDPPIVINLQAKDRWEAIDELINCLVINNKIKPEHRDAIIASVRKRESAMTTGIGFGIGIPHASTDLVSEVVGAVGRSRIGVQFDSLDNMPVKIVGLFLVPQGQFQKHLLTLANIAKLIQKYRDGLDDEE